MTSLRQLENWFINSNQLENFSNQNDKKKDKIFQKVLTQMKIPHLIKIRHSGTTVFHQLRPLEAMKKRLQSIHIKYTEKI